MGVERRAAGRKLRHATNHDDGAARELTERFDAVVDQLAHDESWHRQLRSIRRRHRATWLGSWALHCFAEVGCWFTGVPAQRCTARPGPRAVAGPRAEDRRRSAD